MSEVTVIEVDVIIPVHNASSTIKEAVSSALHQEIPSSPQQTPSPLLEAFLKKYSISVTVCCYDDGSEDESLRILQQIKSSRSEQRNRTQTGDATVGKPTEKSVEQLIPSRLILGYSKDGKARGAGFARNRAIEMNNPLLETKVDNSSCTEESSSIKFLCLLDSDDVMHKYRIIEQTLYMMSIVEDENRERTILGSTFNRDPPGSTWHYSSWANNLTDQRLMLERYREITILHPTWFMPLAVWLRVGGYIEAPPFDSGDTVQDICSRNKSSGSPFLEKCLIHPKFDSLSSLRLAEDLRFFHAHLQLNGILRLHRTSLATVGNKALPLVMYRHTESNQSQSFRTSRKLLLQLRSLAFQNSVIRIDPHWNIDEKRFVIWGCGRDGKDFFKSLDQDIQERVYCFVDVDAKKLNAGYYVHNTSDRGSGMKETCNVTESKKRRGNARKIPILHFSFLISDPQVQQAVRSEWVSNCTTEEKTNFGRIDKSKSDNTPCSPKISQPKKKQKTHPTNSPLVTILKDRGLDRKLLCELPVVVCVAMYRTNGILERNVEKIGRVEGKDIWHFS